MFELTTFNTLKKAWNLFDPPEKRHAMIVLLIMLTTALASAIMVLSIVPFLSVLSDPSLIQSRELFRKLYLWGGFESAHDFTIALGIGSIVLILFGNAMQILRTYAIARFTTMRVHSISYKLLSIYMRQPYLFFLTHHSGEMGTQILSESQQVVQRCIYPAANGFAAILTIAAMVLILVSVEPVISISAFLMISVIYSGLSIFTRKRLKRFGQIRAQANAQRFRVASEALSGIKDIKLLSRESFYLREFSKPSRDMAYSSMITNVIGQVPPFVIMAITFSGIILLCLILIGGTDAQSATRGMDSIVPTIGFLAFAGQRMLPELAKLFIGVTELTSAGPAVDAIYRELAKGEEAEVLPEAPPRPMGLRQSLSLDHVTFRYPNADRVGLNDISLDIRAGERIGVVGTTGSGKTTLANIMLGLLAPDSGRIFVDGQEVNAQNRRAWQATIGYVPQDIFLADACFLQNIAFGVPASEIDRDRVRKAARTAFIDDFITSEYQDGYYTEVGERGVRLSGGQRQRIGIARALYNDADVILFDEATSALDNVTEKEVMRSIEALPGDKTLILIAHRLSTLRGCDRILVLRQGEIVGFDTWDNLMEKSEDFRTMSQMAELP